MYTRKNNERKPRSKKTKISGVKLLMIMVSVMMITVGTVGGTVAFMVDKTNDVVNNFTYAKPGIDIPEHFDGREKKNVQVKNTSDFDAYVRAMVIVTWKNEKGEVSGTPVDPSNYTMKMSSTKWVEKPDGYYYYTDKVSAGKSTANLIDLCKLKEGVVPPEGYDLSVEIVAELIQADPIDAVQEAWPLSPVSTTK